MIRMLRDWAIAVVIGVSVFFVFNWLTTKTLPNGETAPAFTLVNASGGVVSLSDYAGKRVVLNFWGSWCGPCVREIPEFARWSKEHPEVPILGIAVNSGAGAKLARDADRLGVTWPVLESTAAVLSNYGVDVYPTTFVIAPDGKIESAVKGAVDERGLERLVNGR